MHSLGLFTYWASQINGQAYISHFIFMVGQKVVFFIGPYLIAGIAVKACQLLEKCVRRGLVSKNCRNAAKV